MTAGSAVTACVSPGHLPHSLAHSLTHALTHALVHSPMHLLTPSTRPPNHLPNQPLIYSPIRSLNGVAALFRHRSVFRDKGPLGYTEAAFLFREMIKCVTKNPQKKRKKKKETGRDQVVLPTPSPLPRHLLPHHQSRLPPKVSHMVPLTLTHHPTTPQPHNPATPTSTPPPPPHHSYHPYP